MKTPGSLSELIFLVEEAPEGGFTARALGESIFTEADSVASLHDKIRDAVRCHFDEGQVPKVIRLHFVREDGTGPIVEAIASKLEGEARRY